MGRRGLTAGESDILKLIQQEYGPQNTEKEVFFSDGDEAVIFVKARDGSTPILVVLTNLAAFRKDGTIRSDDELIHDWLHIPHNDK